jgi:RES domain-containing protein
VAWRIVQRRLAKHAFTGEGARRYGGRWNSAGLAVIYTAQSQSLAALEILVHVDSENLLFDYVAIPVRIEENLVTRIDALKLPRNWRAYPATKATRALGDAWIVEQESVVLQVPSAVIPTENNFLINPAHPDFRKLVPGKPIPFKFDSRLTKEQT